MDMAVKIRGTHNVRSRQNKESLGLDIQERHPKVLPLTMGGICDRQSWRAPGKEEGKEGQTIEKSVAHLMNHMGDKFRFKEWLRK